MSPEPQAPFPEDATHTGEGLFIGSRAVLLSELSVHLQAQSEQADWHEVLATLKLKVGGEGRLSRAAFFALPEHLEEMSPFLVAIVTLDDDVPGVATWEFNWSRAENDSPPEFMLKSSQEVGGFPGVLERLAASWPGTSPVEARVSASYWLTDDDWRFTLAPAQGKRVVAGEQVLKVRPSHWTITPPSGCVSEISRELSSHSESFKLQGWGNYTFKWTPHFLNEVDGAIWDGLKIFLKPRRSTPKR